MSRWHRSEIISTSYSSTWRQGRCISNTGDDPVYYLVFPPHEMLEVKGQIKEWEARLKIQGWTMETFSMAEAIQEIFQENEFRAVWLASEMDKSFDPDSIQSINETLSDVRRQVRRCAPVARRFPNQPREYCRAASSQHRRGVAVGHGENRRR